MTARSDVRSLSIIPSAGRIGPRPANPLGVLFSLVGLLTLWQERARQRRDLARLDERMLDDIGVGRAEAAHEANKPFWRA